MANLTKSKTIFAFTSPRTIEKIIPEIKLLGDHFSGKKWKANSQLQSDYFDVLFQSEFYEGATYPKNPALAARDRITRAPKALGFVDLEDGIALTKPGLALLGGKRVDEVITRQLLKFQLPSPNHTQSALIDFGVKPYLELLRLTSELEGISRAEIAIFFLQLTHFKKYNKVKKMILSFREQSKQNKKNRKAFVEAQFNAQIQIIYADEIEAGVTRTRQSEDDSLEKFIATKRSNMRDYADALIRYMRATQLVTFNVQSNRLKISEFRHADVDYILRSIRPEPESFLKKAAFSAYQFDDKLPVLLADDRKSLEQKLKNYGMAMAEIRNESIEQLKDRIELIEVSLSGEQNEKIEKGLKDFQRIAELEDVFEQIKSREVPDAPLYLEWNVWRAMVMLNDAIRVDGHFKRDLDGMPLSSAPGNRPDIECNYEDFNLIVEVTLSSGRKQFEMEGEPVAHHFGQIRKASVKPTYCLFVANKLNPGAVAHFFNLNRFNTSAYGGKTSIVPVELSVFRAMVLKAGDENLQDSRYLAKFLHTMVEFGRQAESENEWMDTIRAYSKNWCKVDALAEAK